MNNEDLFLDELEQEEDEDILGGRIFGSNYDNVANDLLSEFGDEVKTKAGVPYNIYKFKKVSGNTNFSTKGQGNLYDIPDNFSQFVNIYNGNEPQVVVWENSTLLRVDENDEIYKEMKVGTYFQGYYTTQGTSNDLENEDIDIFGVSYKSEYVDKSITFEVYEREFNSSDMINALYIIIDKRANIPQLLQLKSFVNEYHPTTHKFIYSTLEFETINFKYAETGRNILEAIQFGAIGEEYAYPKETILEDGSIKVELDENKLFNVNGANRIQFDFNSSISPSSFKIIGRPKNKFIKKQEDGTYKFQAFKPRRLLLNEPKHSKIDTFFYNSPTPYYIVANGIRLEKDGIWDSYRTAWTNDNALGFYNILDQKEVRAGIKFDTSIPIQNYSPDDLSINNIWDERGYIDVSSFLNSAAFQETKKTLSNVRFEGVNTNKLTLADFFNFNSFINENMESLTYSSQEVVKFSLAEIIPILGSLVQTIMGGLDWGWTKTETINKAYKTFCSLIPSPTFIDFVSLFGKTDFQQKLLPLDFFDDNKSKNMLPVNTSLLTSFSFDLTRYFKDDLLTSSQDVIGKGKDGIWDTLYIGQDKFEDGTIINAGNKVAFNLNKVSSYKTEEEEFIIDIIDLKEIGAADLKISAYDISNNSIYSVFTKTTSKIKEDLRLWTNRYKFNYYDEINTIGAVKYPITPSPTPPDDVYDGYYRFIDYDIPLTSGSISWVKNTEIVSDTENYKNYIYTLNENQNVEYRLNVKASQTSVSSILERKTQQDTEFTIVPEKEEVSFSDIENNNDAFSFSFSIDGTFTKLKRIIVVVDDKPLEVYVENLQPSTGPDGDKVIKEFIIEDGNNVGNYSCNNSLLSAYTRTAYFVGSHPSYKTATAYWNGQDWNVGVKKIVKVVVVRGESGVKYTLDVSCYWAKTINTLNSNKNRSDGFLISGAVGSNTTIYSGESFFPNINKESFINSIYAYGDKV